MFLQDSPMVRDKSVYPVGIYKVISFFVSRHQLITTYPFELEFFQCFLFGDEQVIGYLDFVRDAAGVSDEGS